MINKNQISKIYQEKLKKIKKFNKAYFDMDKPLISDHEFDELKRELIELEKTHPFLKLNTSINNMVGSKPSTKFEKVKHSK